MAENRHETPFQHAQVLSSLELSATIWLDGKEFGDVNMLKSVSAEAVEEARYFSTTEAQNRFGLRVTTPVISVTSRKPGS